MSIMPIIPLIIFLHNPKPINILNGRVGRNVIIARARATLSDFSYVKLAANSYFVGIEFVFGVTAENQT